MDAEIIKEPSVHPVCLDTCPSFALTLPATRPFDGFDTKLGNGQWTQYTYYLHRVVPVILLAPRGVFTTHEVQQSSTRRDLISACSCFKTAQNGEHTITFFDENVNRLN